VDFLKTKKAALFCLITGICLITIGFYLSQDSPFTDQLLGIRQTWYLITGLALSVSGVVQFIRDESF
jgi:hypothetical protein